MKKLILAYIVFILIVLGFAGCRAYGSASSEAMGLNSNVQSAVSGAAPKLVSDGQLLQSQASGAVSDAVSRA